VLAYLHQGNILLATLSDIQLYDWPWYICDFHPTSAFERYRQLFEAELELLEREGATDKWVAAYQNIEDLKLTVTYNGETTREFLLHVEGNKARFRAIWQSKSKA